MSYSQNNEPKERVGLKLLAFGGVAAAAVIGHTVLYDGPSFSGPVNVPYVQSVTIKPNTNIDMLFGHCEHYGNLLQVVLKDGRVWDIVDLEPNFRFDANDGVKVSSGREPPREELSDLLGAIQTAVEMSKANSPNK